MIEDLKDIAAIIFLVILGIFVTYLGGYYG